MRDIHGIGKMKNSRYNLTLPSDYSEGQATQTEGEPGRTRGHTEWTSGAEGKRLVIAKSLMNHQAGTYACDPPRQPQWQHWGPSRVLMPIAAAASETLVDRYSMCL